MVVTWLIQVRRQAAPRPGGPRSSKKFGLGFGVCGQYRVPTMSLADHFPKMESGIAVSCLLLALRLHHYSVGFGTSKYLKHKTTVFALESFSMN